MNDDQLALIKYRMEQAERTLHEAELLAQYSEWNGVINRAYYSMFYGALALLLTKGLGASKHTGVLALIDREFVHPGIISMEISALFRDAFNQRQKSDYSELVPASEPRAKEVLNNACQVLTVFKTVIEKQITL